MKNAIPDRVNSFLKNYPPFSLLKTNDLEAISGEVVIQYLQPDEYVFKEGELPNEYIYVVHEGAIHLLQESENILVEQCDEGDVFGIRPLIAEQAYVLSAKAAEQTLIYAIKTDDLKKLIESNPKLGYYLAENFAVEIGNKYSKLFKGRIFLEKDLTQINTQIHEVQSIQHSKKPVACAPHTSIKQAAIKMRNNNVGSILIVNDDFKPLGILTDRDLRNLVVTGEVAGDSPVSTIMNSPVITVAPNRTVADVQIQMMHHRINHLCITEDGTPETKIIGVISEHDMMVLQGNNPAILIREMNRSQSAVDLRNIREKAEDLLRKYLEQEVSIAFIASMMTEINDALITRIIDLVIAELESEGVTMPEVKWCWMGLGSEGRGEQLLRTDQDNALVFANVPPADLKDTKAYFLELAKRVTNGLNTAGFEYCPADMMASNPNWCLSLEEWKNQFTQWIMQPNEVNIMHCNIFFDYRPLYGDFSLTKLLTDHIFNTLKDRDIFIALMAKTALGNAPPLTFFRNLVVEKNGENKDEFDIKKRAMMPLTDIGRLLALDNQISNAHSTIERFEALADAEPNNSELYHQAADAYEILMRYRALDGLGDQSSGRYLNPTDLTKMQRLNLRNSFRPIRSLQEIIKVRFRLHYF